LPQENYRIFEILTVTGESRALVEVLDLKLSSVELTYFHSPAEFVTAQNTPITELLYGTQ